MWIVSLEQRQANGISILYRTENTVCRSSVDGHLEMYGSTWELSAFAFLRSSIMQGCGCWNVSFKYKVVGRAHSTCLFYVPELFGPFVILMKWIYINKKLRTQIVPLMIVQFGQKYISQFLYIYHFCRKKSQNWEWCWKVKEFLCTFLGN